ncbi:MAG: NUDIX domain-containing protein [Pseudomonadota bacterium]
MTDGAGPTIPRDDPSMLRYVAGVDLQAGVLAWLPDVDPIRFIIVTSRRTRRWVFPKGSIDKGMTAPEAAAQEALEEAGVVGTADATPFGSYRTPKIRPPLIWTVEVSLYAMRIDEVLDVWIESDQRERRFVTIDEAAELLSEPEMTSLARQFLASLQSN